MWQNSFCSLCLVSLQDRSVLGGKLELLRLGGEDTVVKLRVGGRGFATVVGAGWNILSLFIDRQGLRKPTHSSGTLASLVTTVSGEWSQLYPGRRTHNTEESPLPVQSEDVRGKWASVAAWLHLLEHSMRHKGEQSTLVMVTVPCAICVLQTARGV